MASRNGAARNRSRPSAIGASRSMPSSPSRRRGCCGWRSARPIFIPTRRNIGGGRSIPPSATTRSRRSSPGSSPLTTQLFGDSELAVRIAAPLLHFATALVIFALARRLYDARVAAWSAVTYATLPGVSRLGHHHLDRRAAAVVLGLGAARPSCARATRADGNGGPRSAPPPGSASSPNMRWPIGWSRRCSYLLAFRDERRHLEPFLGAVALALADLCAEFRLEHGARLRELSPHRRQRRVPRAALPSRAICCSSSARSSACSGRCSSPRCSSMLALARGAFADRRAAFLAFFALPTLAMMLVVSTLSRAEPNWAAPAYVSATVLVVAWLLARGWRVDRHCLGRASRHRGGGAARAARCRRARSGWDVPAKYDVLHRLRGYERLGEAVAGDAARASGRGAARRRPRDHGGAPLLRAAASASNALKWNGDDDWPHDQFDIDAKPQSYLGGNMLLVSASTDIGRHRRALRRGRAGRPHHHSAGRRRASGAMSCAISTGFKGYR